MTRAYTRACLLVSLGLGGPLSCGSEPEPVDVWVDEREPCADQNPLRNVYFGDLHVHTSFSFDAYLSDVRVDPAEAYRFARGDAVLLPPLGEDGLGTQSVQLDRPLDFAAVTDHAEYLAEVNACVTEGSGVYDTEMCQEFREQTVEIFVRFGLGLNTDSPSRFQELCGDGGIDCLSLATEVWQRVRDAAEGAYDRSEACEFTSFVGYEWSGARQLSNLHRNVIFRSSVVPELPVSHFEQPEAVGLWEALESDCIDGLFGCDVLAIPHNSNWSNGRLFNPDLAPGAAGINEAVLQSKLEPLVEIFQHKGDSECENAVSGILGEPDELCGFEKLLPPSMTTDCGDGVGSQGMLGFGCVSRRDYVRGALLAGMETERDVGINPLKLGIIASTDTHNGTPGATAEDRYIGHFGNREESPQARLTAPVPGGPRNSPGGLVAVWAEENTREALFDAMRRRETYGTSGTRLAVRFFGGWDFPDNLCEGSLVETGYERGVPMGSDLPDRTEDDGAPVFALSALRDPGVPGSPGTPLQRAQIIKGWLDAEGQRHVTVYDVAGGDNGATVDMDTCEPQTAGSDSLCAVWRDPDFDPSERAYYYARVVEDPVCRWSARDCAALPPDLPPEERPAACDDPELEHVIQERAWTSPIWY